MQLNQIPTQMVGGEVTELEQRIAENAANVMPEEPPASNGITRFIAGIPQPVVWLGGMLIALSLLGQFKKR
jgi:hypothetical protein